MGKINKLPQKLVNKIAAGEVVERPASIVKELIENSLDAEADSIEIIIEKGGIKSIIIHDNGVGMSPSDAEKSFKLHTTSKIYNLKDLNRIYTLGFRGEALASIAAVSELTIFTKAKSEKGLKLTIEDSKLKNKKFQERSIGTTVKVQDIFRHLPARKKFLRTENTEYKHIVNEVTKFAIINPSIEFILNHNGKETLKLLSVASIQERITQIYPNFTKENLIKFNYEDPEFKIDAILVHPRNLGKNRYRQFIYVNNRAIVERSLSKAVREGYATTIPKDKHPAFFININIDVSKIDVNIHPRKQEIKIDNISKLYGILKGGIRNTLSKNSQNELKQKIHTKTLKHKAKKEAPIKQYSVPKTPKRDSSSRSNRKKVIKESVGFTKSLLTKSDKDRNYFQIFNTYIILEKEQEIHIIDQHAADERINYEKILTKFEKGELVTKQDLLLPISIDLSHEEIETLKPKLSQISKLGLDIDIFGSKTIKVNSVPQFARDVNYKELIFEIIEKINNIENQTDIEELVHKLTSSIACHTSIRAGRKMHPAEITKLIDDLFECKQPFSCPHGRPIIWTITKKELEKKFNRIK
ncbi:DNA mismatch repair endonuclease MutL [Candidatus Dojkabacteria bacterium]|nr:DNA mismatch repair endonuclease MutL [Candidatus Dojkabacteria bacterium]